MTPGSMWRRGHRFINRVSVHFRHSCYRTSNRRMNDVTTAQPGATEFVYVPYTYQDYPCRRGTYVFAPGQPNTVARRNERERRRVRLVNLGFARLRQYIPHMTKSKKLSKVETLRSAIDYIKRLQQLLQEQDDPRMFLETNPQDELNRYQEGCNILSRCSASSNWNSSTNLRADSNYCNASVDDIRYYTCSV